MTDLQKQCLLTYLGYDPGPIDGIDGPKTQAAIAKFRSEYGMGAEGLVAAVAGTAAKLDKPEVGDYTEAEKYLRSDGCYHIPRGVDVQLTKNFWAHEIHCQGVGCCKESVISKRIMDLAQEVRDDIGEPLEIGSACGSGYRCPKHNAETTGASPTSLHTISDAVDLHYKNPSALKAAILKHLKDGEVGLYSWGCHVGMWDRGYISQFNR